MRIEAYTQVQPMYQSKKMNYSQKTGTVSSTDMVQISSIGKDFQNAKAAVAASADVREDVIAPLKAKIQNGSYQVDAESFADKLMKKYAEMR